MARTPSGTNKPEGASDPAIAELYRLMVARDQLMWEQLTQRDSTLQDRMMDLFSRLLEASSVDRVLVSGFTEISEQLHEQLQPLRELAPSRTPLSDADDKALASLRRALARPDFSISQEDRPSAVVPVEWNDSRSLLS
ncbi:hypothetical protein QO004_006208 [Rhizobium mesoamericanum]|uniref:hypothetical protein n=1 Tax=Rhizobium mesoamericanum TaxID=1079800 RepID=UPI00278170CE|nr:hypothetical protein [Rhizobium mesoamericanum]MDQ0564390.1 hypothetical protein [Rhizobium mesoamericanum]